MKKATISIALIILGIFFWSSGNARAQKEISVKHLNAQGLKAIQDNKEGFVFIDVNIPEEKHIAGTTGFIPFDTLKAEREKLPKNKDTKIVLYDRDGSMSLQAARVLAEMGYTNVWNLDGGVLAWERAGFPVGGSDRIIYLKARQFSFSPDTIRVKQGDRVKIIAESLDVTHGFAVPELNINSAIEPGRKTIIKFTADKKGKYGFVCSVYCGLGHSRMRGELIVE